MAEIKNAPLGAYSADMDGESHEGTYRGFIRFAEIGASFVICIVLGLAVGGMRHAWLSAVFGIILAHITTAMALFAPKLAWRGNAVVAGLLILMLLFYRSAA